MLIRDVSINDFPKLKELLSSEGLESGFLFHALQESSEGLVLESDGVCGFILLHRLGELNEITHWFVRPGFASLFDSLQRKVNGSLAVSERESKKERIDLLKSVGFKEIRSLDGIYHDDKAVLLVKD